MTVMRERVWLFLGGAFPDFISSEWCSREEIFLLPSEKAVLLFDAVHLAVSGESGFTDACGRPAASWTPGLVALRAGWAEVTGAAVDLVHRNALVTLTEKLDRHSDFSNCRL